MGPKMYIAKDYHGKVGQKHVKNLFCNLVAGQKHQQMELLTQISKKEEI